MATQALQQQETQSEHLTSQRWAGQRSHRLWTVLGYLGLAL
jgi:hypothetical protein